MMSFLFRFFFHVLACALFALFCCSRTTFISRVKRRREVMVIVGMYKTAIWLK